ncbi:M91 family zinc metallopeptidase [Flavobacterium sp. 316]|uniref:M91 family zinc metallopeptidase n=1 Tax=Flavobacterium sp. 316 TaxID=1603293 RepID=UPI002100F614|nr:M91 family zinc metallopeptidase [Flavobacterium sp. 316]
MDVAGDSLYVTHRKGFLGLGGKETLLYENGTLYNEDGSEYTGKKKGFLKKVTNALAEISEGQEGADMIKELQSSSNVFTIEKGSSEFRQSDTQKAYRNQIQTDPNQNLLFSALSSSGFNFNGGSGGTIYWNTSGSSLPTTSGMRTSSSTDLAHEMFHALDANRGTMDDRLEQGGKRNEWQAVYRENNLRTQLGLPQRTHYIIQSNLSTGSKIGTGPRMLTPAPLNQNIKPTWYQ